MKKIYNLLSLFSFVILCLISLPCFAIGTISTSSLHSNDTSDNTFPIKYKRIIVTGNCPVGILLSNKVAAKHLVGVGPYTFTYADMNLLKAIKPNIDQVSSSYIDNDYRVNIESLINLHPDVIFYDGPAQDDHLERIGIPTVNLSNLNDPRMLTDPEFAMIHWEKRFDDTLGLPETHKYKDAWAKTKKIISPFVNQIKAKHLTALYIHTSNSKQILVSGPKTFLDSYLSMVGLKNVAQDLPSRGASGRFISVSIEQIMQWNPDIILVARGSAKKILNNGIPGQGWENLNAVKNGKVYSLPAGIHSWGGISAETPLLPIYIINQIDNHLISDVSMREITQNYYKKMFDYDIPNNILNRVLAQR